MSFGDASVAPELPRAEVGTDPRPFTAEVGAGLAPGAGLADASGMFPAFADPDQQYYDGLITNLADGNYGTAAMQGLAMLGDAMWAAGPVAGAVGTTGKMPLALSRAIAKRSSAFQQRFQGSQIIDEVDGGPRLVAHGTNKDFPVFDPTRGELGTHFGSIQQAGWRVGVDGANMRAGYLVIKNPLRMEDHSTFDVTAEGVKRQLERLGINPHVPERMSLTRGYDQNVTLGVQQRIKEKGYDGVVYLNRHEVTPNTNDRKPEGMLFSTWQRKLRDMSDDEFRHIFPEAEDSYIIFDSDQFINAFGAE